MVSSNWIIKFIDNNYINAFRDKGELHFETVNSFIEMDEKFHDSVQGDKKESKFYQTLDASNYDVSLYSHKLKKEIPIGFSKLNIDITFPELLKQNIFCFTLLNWHKDFTLRTSNNGDKEFVIKKDIAEKLTNIAAGRPFVLMEFNYFIRKLDDYGKSNNVNFKRGQITYQDNYPIETTPKININKLTLDQAIKLFLFNKRVRYSDQLEYRIVMRNDFNHLLDDNFNLHIGNFDKNNCFIVQNSGLSSLKFIKK